jgi:hypothetical protein
VDVKQAVVAELQRTLSLWRATSIRLGTDHLCRLIRYRSAPTGTAHRQGVSASQGTRMAHVCHRWLIAPFVAKYIHAGEPLCLHREAH